MPNIHLEFRFQVTPIGNPITEIFKSVYYLSLYFYQDKTSHRI